MHEPMKSDHQFSPHRRTISLQIIMIVEIHSQFQTVTAGKFKRTLTPTKKITKEDLAKSEEDIAEIFQLFKGWVAQNRPQLNIDEVATGETWYVFDFSVCMNELSNDVSLPKFR